VRRGPCRHDRQGRPKVERASDLHLGARIEHFDGGDAEQESEVEVG
jgi:hypothetical protein